MGALLCSPTWHRRQALPLSRSGSSLGSLRPSTALRNISNVRNKQILVILTSGSSTTVGLESVAMFGNFGLVAVWCFTVWKSHLALQRESKVFLLGFLMEFSSYDLNQWLWRHALFKMEIPLQRFPSF